MSEHNKHELVAAVIEQIQIEVMETYPLRDMDPITWLLHYIPEKALEEYLPEEEYRDQRVIDALRGVLEDE